MQRVPLGLERRTNGKGVFPNFAHVATVTHERREPNLITFNATLTACEKAARWPQALGLHLGKFSLDFVACFVTLSLKRLDLGSGWMSFQLRV